MVGPDSGDVESDSAAAPGSHGGEDVDVGHVDLDAGEEDLDAARQDADAAGAGAWTDASEHLTASVPDDIRRLDEIDTELGGVDAALLRLSDGTYGTCELCGAALDGEALHRDPLTTRCPDHAA